MNIQTNITSFRDVSFGQIRQLKRFTTTISRYGYDVLSATPKIQNEIVRLQGIVRTIDDTLRQKRTFGRALLDLITLQFIKIWMLKGSIGQIRNIIDIRSAEITSAPGFVPPPVNGFGPKAFEPPKDFKFPTIPAINRTGFDSIARHYSSWLEFNTNNNLKIVDDLLWVAYSQGTLFALQKARFIGQDDIKKMMAVILRELEVKGAAPTPKQMAIANRLGDAFKGCQDLMYREMASIVDELLSRTDLVAAITVFWQEYKMAKLDNIILKNHPHCPTAGTPPEQFPHLKSGYIVQFGQKYGFAGLEAAKRDIYKPQYGLNDISNEFERSLNLEEFARNIAVDINRPNQEASLLDKTLVFKWINSGEQPSGFGYHDDSKDYKDMAPATLEQKDLMAPYMTVDEAMTLLKHPKIGISG